MIQNKEDIKSGLQENFQLFVDFVNKLDKNSFEDMPDGKWSAGQQLDHLIKSTRPLNMVLLLPKFIYPLIWGKMNRKPKSFDELLNRYNEKLAKGGTASSPFIPPIVKFEQKNEKINKFNTELKRIISRLGRLTDTQLDSLILPHPLLGKISLREMMFFTILHTEHHLNILKKRRED